MAAKKPLVLYNGQIAQIQPGDTVDAPSQEVDIVSLTNAEVATMNPGAPVYIFGSGSAKLARANAGATTRTIGIARAAILAAAAGEVQTDGIATLTTGEWDTITGGTGGLTVGTVYYLNAATAGMLTTTAPTAGGSYVVEIGQAVSATELDLNVKSPIQL